jgi:hypothetical protein
MEIDENQESCILCRNISMSTSFSHTNTKTPYESKISVVPMLCDLTRLDPQTRHLKPILVQKLISVMLVLRRSCPALSDSTTFLTKRKSLWLPMNRTLPDLFLPTASRIHLNRTRHLS